jgi:hypothetical protein
MNIAGFGRLLQVAGMILLPIGLSFGLMKDEVQIEVRLLAIGGFLFLLGWILAKKA